MRRSLSIITVVGILYVLFAATGHAIAGGLQKFGPSKSGSTVTTSELDPAVCDPYCDLTPVRLTGPATGATITTASQANDSVNFTWAHPTDTPPIIGVRRIVGYALEMGTGPGRNDLWGGVTPCGTDPNTGEELLCSEIGPITANDIAGSPCEYLGTCTTTIGCNPDTQDCGKVYFEDGHPLYLTLWTDLCVADRPDGGCDFEIHVHNDYYFNPGAKFPVDITAPLEAGPVIKSPSINVTWDASAPGTYHYLAWQEGRQDRLVDLYSLTDSSPDPQSQTRITDEIELTGQPLHVKVVYDPPEQPPSGDIPFWVGPERKYEVAKLIELTSPVVGVPITTWPVRFDWDDGSIEAKRVGIWIGSSPGTYNLYNSTVRNISDFKSTDDETDPARLSQLRSITLNGQPLYVRVYTSFATTGTLTLYNEYVLTRANIPPVASLLLAPPSSIRFGSGQIGYRWDSGFQIERQYLWFGSAAQDNPNTTVDDRMDLITRSPAIGTLTDAFAYPFPQDKDKIYVILWSKPYNSSLPCLNGGCKTECYQFCTELGVDRGCTVSDRVGNGCPVSGSKTGPEEIQ